MRKSFVLGALTAAMTLSLGMTAFAAQWQQDDIGWWWQNDDGSYPVSQWVWLDGNGDGTAQCYYFDEEGYCYQDGETPDGYLVNEDGAWIVDDVVQTQTVTAEEETESVDLTALTGPFNAILGLDMGDDENDDLDQLFQDLLAGRKHYSYTVEIDTDNGPVTCPLYDAAGTTQYTTNNHEELIYAGVENSDLTLYGGFFYLNDGTLAFKLTSYEANY